MSESARNDRKRSAAVPTDGKTRHIWIKGALEAVGSSFSAIAREMGVTYQYVQASTTKNAAEPQEKMAEKLGIPVHELFPEFFDGAGKRIKRAPGRGSRGNGCVHNSGRNIPRNVEAGKAA